MGKHDLYNKEWWYHTGYLYQDQDTFPSFSYMFALLRNCVDISIRDTMQNNSDDYIMHFYLYNINNKSRIFKEEIFVDNIDTIDIKNGKLNLHGKKNDVEFVWKGDVKEMSFFIIINNDTNINFTLYPQTFLKHGKGVIPMGNGGNSFYYSFPDTKIVGNINLHNEKIYVTGISWIDHQWGNFSSPEWQWAGILLENQIIMLYYFPETGIKIGTYKNDKGEIGLIKSFNMKFLTKIKFKGEFFSLPNGEIVIPSMNAKLNVRPIDSMQLNNTVYTSPYWEGLCTVNGIINNNKIDGFLFYETW